MSNNTKAKGCSRRLRQRLAAGAIAFICACPATLAENESDIRNSSEPIKLGVIAELTGVGGPASKELVNGVELFLDQIHHQVGDRKIEAIIEDDQGDPAVALQKLQKLVEKDKVDIMDGIVLSNIAYAIATHVDNFQTPLVCAESGADDLTKNKRHKWFVRCGYSSSQLSMPFGEYAFKTLGYKRVATIGQNFPFSWETIGGFHKTFEDAGGQIVQKVWTPLEVTDFTPFIKQIHDDVDAVFVCTAIGPGKIFPTQFRSVKAKMPLIGSGMNFDEVVIKSTGKATLGGVSCQTWSPAIDSPANKKFIAAYKAKYKTNPSSSAECGYTSGLFIAQALKAVHGNTSDKEKLLDALKKVELTDTPRGTIRLDQYANPVENVYIRKVADVNGTLENEIVQTYKGVSQFWKYDPKEYLKQPEYRRAYPPCKHCVEAATN